MNDLFENIEEKREERIAIKTDAGIPISEAIEQTRIELHACEIRDLIRRFYPSGPIVDYFKMAETHRGKAATDALKADCRIAWAAHHAAQKDAA